MNKLDKFLARHEGTVGDHISAIKEIPIVGEELANIPDPIPALFALACNAIFFSGLGLFLYLVTQ